MAYDSTKIYTETNKGKIYIRTKSGKIIDLSKDQIITRGLTVSSNEVNFDNSQTINLGLKKMNYRAFIDTGKIKVD